MIALPGRFAHWPVRAQLICGIAIANALVMGIFVYDVVARQHQFLHNQRVAESESMVEGLARNATSWVLSNDVAGLQELLSGFATYPDLRYVMIIDPQGQVLAHSDPSRVGLHLADPVSRTLSDGKAVTRRLVDDDDTLDIASPIVAADRLIGWARMATSTAATKRALQVVSERGAIYALAAIVIGALVTIIITLRLTRGLYQLIGLAKHIVEGRHDVRAENGRMDEVGQLNSAVNEMLDALAANENRLQAASENLARLNAELDERVALRTAQLEAANRELEAFSYSVSHDLRAPLRTIDGYSQMLEEDLQDRLDDETRRLLGVVRGASRKMGQLIEDLLTFSKFGRQAMNVAEVDMTALARAVWHEIQDAPDEKQCSFVIQDLPRIRGDGSLLKQVWINLLSNAKKYSSKSEGPMVEVSGEASAGMATFRVRDNGVGFDMKYYEKLFGVFQRLHSAEEFPGTGVGLAIVQRVIARHGGRVWAESELGKGSVFQFTLPLTPPS